MQASTRAPGSRRPSASPNADRRCVACLGAVFGARRVLLLALCCSHDELAWAAVAQPAAFLATQFLSGVGSGTFIPLTIAFIIRSLPARLVVFGIAIYAMNSELSQNVAASLEGWYSDHWSWRWIDWQYCAALPLMFGCICTAYRARARIPCCCVISTGRTRLFWAGIRVALRWSRSGQSA